MATRFTQWRIPEALLGQIELEAKKQGRTRSGMMNRILSLYFRDEPPRLELYKVSHYDTEQGECVQWATSAEEAAGMKRKVDRDYSTEAYDPDPIITSITIRADKQSLANWLNANFTRDNG